MEFSLNVMEIQWIQRIQQNWQNQLWMNWGQFKNSACRLWLGDWVVKMLAYHMIGHKTESFWFRIFLVRKFIEFSENYLGKTQILNVFSCLDMSSIPILIVLNLPWWNISKTHLMFLVRTFSYPWRNKKNFPVQIMIDKFLLEAW